MLNLFQHPSPRIVPHVEKQPCVYMLASQAYGTLYIGVTSGLVARLWQHRSGQGKGFTSRSRVHRLVRFKLFGNMTAAIGREKRLKRGIGSGRSISWKAKTPIGMTSLRRWAFRRS